MKKLFIFSLGVTTGVLVSKKIGTKIEISSSKSENLVNQMNDLYQSIMNLNNDTLKDKALDILDTLKNELSKPVKNIKTVAKSINPKKLKSENA